MGTRSARGKRVPAVRCVPGPGSDAMLPLRWTEGQTDGREGTEGLPSLGPAFSGSLRPPREPLTGALSVPPAAQGRVAGDISHASPHGGRNPSPLLGGVPAGGNAAGPHLRCPRRTLPGASKPGPGRTPHAAGPAWGLRAERPSPCPGQCRPSGTSFSDSQQPGHTAGRKVQAETPSLPSGLAPGPAPEPGTQEGTQQGLGRGLGREVGRAHWALQVPGRRGACQPPIQETPGQARPAWLGL